MVEPALHNPSMEPLYRGSDLLVVHVVAQLRHQPWTISGYHEPFSVSYSATTVTQAGQMHQDV